MDSVTTYARGVDKGKIISGPHVRDACRRHLKDLREAPERGFFFDAEKANWALDFFKEVLMLNGGDFEGVPYEPLPWQSFIIGSIFGWVNEKGFRRYRVAFIETSKGSGKSPLAAGIGIYGLVADNEPRAEIYAAATKKDQAMVLFRDAVAMVNLSSMLSSRITTSGTGQNVWNLAYLQNASFFRPISADDGQSGPRPHMGLLDEIHEHKNSNVVEMLRAGTKGRNQALMLMITNSGHDKTSVCWNYHEYARKVAAGSIEDDSFFSYVCAMDKDDEPFEDESCWIKTNPSLGVTIKREYLREQVTAARGMPSKESIVRRLNFSQWVGSDSPWISSDVWFSCQDVYDSRLLLGRSCYGGLDLSSTQDLTSLVLLFEPTDADPYYRLWPYFWLPEDGLKKKGELDGVDYLAWVRQGHLETTPGKAISKSFVASRVAEINSAFNVKSIGFDRWRIEDFMQQLEEMGINAPMEPFGQGYKDMAPAVDQFERLLINADVKHNQSPVLTWCAANAVIETDPAGNRKLSKRKATGRIDGIVAAVMAVGQSISVVEEEGSFDEYINNPIMMN